MELEQEVQQTGVNDVPAAEEQVNQNQGQQAAPQANQPQAPPQSIPYERFQEVNNKVKELEQQVQLSRQQIALYQANMQNAQAQQPQQQVPNFYEGLEDDDVMTVAEAKKATQAMVQQFSSAINELQFLVQHPDYHQLVGTPQQLGEPLKQAILKNPQIMTEIRYSPNPMLTAYNYAKMAQMSMQDGKQQQQQPNQTAAAAIQAASRPGSVSMVANRGALNAANRFAAMSDEEFAKYEAEVLSKM